ncbi:MAG: hypothetical protein QF524_06785, partial [Planctomycetota bacterium]|nr:hypothetical protein [Planctomycetota bacterium]
FKASRQSTRQRRGRKINEELISSFYSTTVATELVSASEMQVCDSKATMPYQKPKKILCDIFFGFNEEWPSSGKKRA